MNFQAHIARSTCPFGRRLARPGSLGVAFALLAVAAGACAGSPPANSPEGVNAAPTPPTTSIAPAQDAGPTTTTTLTLGDGGDLTGSKLSTSGSQTLDVTVDGGAKSHAPDLGRGNKDIQAIVVARRDDARACYDAA